MENLVELYFFFETPANVFLKITPPPPTKPQTNNQKQYMHAWNDFKQQIYKCVGQGG